MTAALAPAAVSSSGSTGMAAIAAQIASVQARIAVINGVPAATDPTTATSAAATASGASFASALGAATAPATAAPAAGTAGDLAAGAPSGAATGSAVVSDASRYLGIPYVWGGESTSGMDCSGLVQRTFHDLGVSLPRTAAEQQRVGTPVASLAEARPGDLLFFGDPAHHVAIYAGNNELIESPEPGKTVHRTAVYETPTTISRVVPSDVAAVAAAPGTAAAAPTVAALENAGVHPAVAAYAGQFTAAERAYGLPPGLLAAVAQQESGGDPHAVSPAGAEGLMQLMPATAAGQGVDPMDPAQAIGAAARILHRNLDEFGGSVPLALAAYNAGAGAVHRYGGIPPYSETQNYVRRITATLAAGG